MSDPTIKTEIPIRTDSIRNWLIGGTLAVAAAIIFGILYLFVIAPSIPNGNVGWFLFSFATGLTMIIMPCTLPLAFVIVPLSMGKGIVRGLGMAIAFGLGIAFTLSLYGVAAALLGGVAIGALGADLETLKNWVYFIAGTFALIFALSEIGLLNIHMPTYSGAAPAFIQKRQEIFKAFFLGLFLGNVGVGCPHPATPLILIEIATSGDVFYGWLLFLVHAIGRILPLLLLAFLAILGVNGLNWLMTRKATLERVTGWAMVFVAGFILTLGLFSHDWWVNSGIHSALETITQESKFNALINDTLGTNVAHVHGLEDGEGLFGLPLEWGSVFLVLMWIIPIWWWYFRRRRTLLTTPSFKLQALEAHIDRLEHERRQIESMFSIDEAETTYDLKLAQIEIDTLEAKRREEESKIQYGETGLYKEPIGRAYEVRILGMQRNYFILISIFLALIFIHYLPTNFYFKSISGVSDHHGDTSSGATHDHTTVKLDEAGVNKGGTSFESGIYNLPEAQGLQFVDLADGDSYTITASYVKKKIGNDTVRMLAYNGSIPGPFIKIQQGSHVTIHFINKTDIEQTIHSHGLRLNNNFDGVPGVTQYAVKPGESFSYEIDFPDAGVAWYHPHTRDDYGQEMGLYGNYLISPKEATESLYVNREVPLIIDDILIENNVVQDFYKEFTNHALLGRFGNNFLVNGDTEYSLNIKKGEVIRFQITNASNARTYRLSMPGAIMKVVGSDLSRYEAETFKSEVLISPAERLVIEAYFGTSGKVKLQNRMKESKATIAEFIVSDTEVADSFKERFDIAQRDAVLSNTFDNMRTYIDRVPDKRLTLTVALTGDVNHEEHSHGAVGQDMSAMDSSQNHSQMMQTMHGLTDNIEWGEKVTGDETNTSKNVEWMIIDEATGKKSLEIPVTDWTFTQGQLVKIRITNDMMSAHVMQHPIHLHGQRFVVLSENGVLTDNMAWKDTALVLPGGYIDILVEMSNLGEWMLHCHISEHLHSGMMMPFRVQDQNGYATGDEFRSKYKLQTQSTRTSSSFEGSKKSYRYEDVFPSAYSVLTSTQKIQVDSMENIALSFKDSLGNSVNLNTFLPMVVRVTFVKSDNSIQFMTYPGNQTFPEPAKMETPATDGHDHIHFLGIKEAYAHGDIVEDGHHSENTGKTYTVPVKFLEPGEYKGFVEFILEGEETPRIATISVTATKRTWDLDNFNWSSATKWWVLLLISISLMIPLSMAVRKYVNTQ